MRRKQKDAVFNLLFWSAWAVVGLSVSWVAWRTWVDPRDCTSTYTRREQTMSTRFGPVREKVVTVCD